MRRRAPIRVALVDDQQLVRAGFRMVIDSQADLEVVLEAGDGAQAVRALDPAALTATGPVDVVLMDVRMPTMDGLTATAQITARATEDRPAPRVIVLTTFDLDEYVLAAIRAGASGFLLKDAPPEEMLGAIRTVHRGDAVIAPSSTKRLLEHLVTALPPDEPGAPTDPARLAVADLTDREREVLVLMARGPLEHGDRLRPVRRRGHGQDARRPHPGQAARARPGAGRRRRVRDRAGPPGVLIGPRDDGTTRPAA